MPVLRRIAEPPGRPPARDGAGAGGPRGRERTELLQGLALATAVGVFDLVDHTLGPVGIPATDLLIVAPLVTAARAGGRTTAWVAAYAVGLSLVLGPTHATARGVDFLVVLAIVAAGSTLAVWVARGRERAELAARERVRELDALRGIADDALEHRALDDLLPRITDRIVRALRVDVAVLRTADGARRMRWAAASGAGESLAGSEPSTPGSFTSRVIRCPGTVVTEDLRAGGAGDPWARELGLSSLAGVMLRAGGRVTGVLEVGTFALRDFSEHDHRLLHLGADRAAMAIERTRLYEREQRIAATLQQSLTPRRLPDVPGIDLAAEYSAAGDGQTVGGDFYDVILADSKDVLLVIGDACGKGPEAAATTALVRYTLREAAAGDGRPAALVAGLNRAFRRERAPEDLCSVAIARLSPQDDGAIVLRVALAGHPPPLVLGPGPAQPVGAHGLLLGAASAPLYAERTVRLRPGDQAVFYTDGVTESAHGAGRLGVLGLAALLDRSRGASAADTLRRLGRRIDVLEQRDDRAVVVARARTSTEPRPPDPEESPWTTARST